LSRELGEAFVRGRDLELSAQEFADCTDGVVLVRSDEITLGTGLLRGTHLKNQIPRSAVIPE
ncbi:MAG: methyltransferase RsmF C-terminal domain-like protein, partial [bacterium JZ-2024 1]